MVEDAMDVFHFVAGWELYSGFFFFGGGGGGG